ncbi:unnamed protein product [Haemonchus placei]|uniref:Skp1_POZ domain-containing protein n=1 Tax=Haemonchus placei TaxID=6290 RepID=A0A0N4WN56_HAEPC|nr:unnamed protein product [Haemonchus placei]
MSKLVTTMLEDLNLQDDDAPIPIPNVTAPVFKKVLAWCEKQKTHEKEGKQLLETWSEEFFKVEYPVLFEIIMAANYLDIPKLLDDGCRKIALMMKASFIILIIWFLCNAQGYATPTADDILLYLRKSACLVQSNLAT